MGMGKKLTASVLLGVAVLFAVVVETRAQGDMSREAWIAGILGIMPVMVCEGDSPYKLCFSVTEAECREAAEHSMRGCTEALKDAMPISFGGAGEESFKWGFIIGACGSLVYSTRLEDRSVNSAYCNDPVNWDNW